MPIRIISGNVLEAKEQYICHQTNCLSVKALGLTKAIFERYPEANTYAREKANERIIGKIDVFGRIINMNAQTYPGPPKSLRLRYLRLAYFEDCLELIGILNPKSLAFGCGLADGQWEDYLALIQKFSDAHPEVEIVVYRFFNE